MLLVSVLIGGCSAHKEAHDRLFNYGEMTTKPEYCGGDHKKCKGRKLGKVTADQLRKKLKEIDNDPKNPFDELALILLIDSRGRRVTFFLKILTR